MAFTESEVFITVLGNKVFGCYKLTGDGSDTTFVAPIGTIDSAWVQAGTDTALDSDSTISWSGSTITFGTAPVNTGTLWVFFIGSA